MLKRINHSVTFKFSTKNGFVWGILRHNISYSNRFNSKGEYICHVYKDDTLSNPIVILDFDNYLDFKKFKDKNIQYVKKS